MKKVLSLVGLICILWTSSIAQPTNFIHYTVADGLAQSQGTCLFQDSKGYIWIGTKGGASKFDGFTFENFTISNGLQNNYCNNFLEDKDGNVILNTRRAISIISQNQVRTIPFPEGYKSENMVLTNDGITILISILEASENKYKNVIFKDGKFTDVHFTFNQRPVVFYSLFYQNNKLMGINPAGDLFEINPDFRVNKQLSKGKNITRQVGNTELVSSANTTYFFKEDKLQLFCTAESSFGTSLSDGNIAVSTNLSTILHIYNRQALHIQNIDMKYAISALLADREGNLWVGTEVGLFKQVIFNNYNFRQGMPEDIWSIFEDNTGKVHFGSFNQEMATYSEADNKIVDRKNVPFRFYFGSKKLSNGDVLISGEMSLMKFKDGKFSKFQDKLTQTLNIYEDTIHKSLFILDSDQIYFRNHFGHEYILRYFYEIVGNGSQFSMILGKDGNYWVMAGSSIIRISPRFFEMIAQNKYKEVQRIDKKEQPETEKSLHSLSYLYKIYRRYQEHAIYGATDVAKDHNGNLWIAAINGLYFFDYKTFHRIPIANLEDFLISIRNIDEKTLVFGGLRGIGVLNTETFYKEQQIDCQYYDKDNGFGGYEVNQVGIFKDSKGRIWIPTASNVVMFNPKDLKANKIEPLVHISKFEHSSDRITWHEKSSGKLLNYKENNIKISFTGICHTAPSQVKFKYILEGLDEKWSTETKDRTVNYNNLPPGNYTFKILACNNNGVWTKIPEIYPLEIRPAWWQTKIFMLISACLFLLFFYWIIKMYSWRKSKKLLLEVEKADLQMRAFKGQLYPHFFFNALNGISSLVYRGEREAAYDYFTTLAENVRTIMDDSQKSERPLGEELTFVKNYLKMQEFRFKNRFSSLIHVQENVDLSLRIPTLLIQLHVENAVKHGLEPKLTGGLLQIEARRENGETIFSIEDNGIGRKKAKELATPGSGKGTYMLEEMIAVYQKKFSALVELAITDLYDDALNPAGTRVLIRIKK